jgi:hypothetical protein
MLKPYDVLTRCQQELSNCKLQAVDKLRIEMNILVAKRIMIDCRVDDNIEKEIKEAYDEICQLSSSVGKEGDVRRIILRLQNLVESMKVTERRE